MMAAMAEDLATPVPLGALGEAVLVAAEHARIGVSVTFVDRPDPPLAFINDAGAAILGHPKGDLVGKPAGAILTPEEQVMARERVRKRAAGEPAPPWNEATVFAKDGRRVTIHLGISMVRIENRPAVVAFFLDATERKQMEARLVQADRLAALGTLVAGIAHEINNPVTCSLLALGQACESLALLEGPSEVRDRARARLEEARQGAERIAAIVHGLRSFVRPAVEARGAVDLRQVVLSAVRLSQNEIRHRAKLVTTFEENLPPVEGSASQLEQLFLNLLVNASQALPEGGSDNNEIRVRIQAGVNDEVIAEVSDNGAGIAPEDLPRLFDPFFTTKPASGGMGLGLFICHSIARGHRGSLDVESQRGQGATFRVRLPVFRRAPAEAPAAAPAVVEDGVSTRRRLLIIDDEAILGAALARELEPSFDCHWVADGRTAMELLTTREVDAVICDLMMPGMTGMDLHAEAARLRPGLERRFVFMTGGAFTPRAVEFLAQTKAPVLEKPFAVAALRAALAKSLA